MFYPDNYGLLGEAFQGRADCDCISKADGATDRKLFPSCGLLSCKAQESGWKVKNQISILQG